LLTLFGSSIFFWRCLLCAYPRGPFSCSCPDEAFQENAYTVDLFQQHMLFLIEGDSQETQGKETGKTEPERAE
jgi:hypothetical protein